MVCKSSIHVLEDNIWLAHAELKEKFQESQVILYVQSNVVRKIENELVKGWDKLGCFALSACVCPDT